MRQQKSLHYSSQFLHKLYACIVHVHEVLHVCVHTVMHACSIAMHSSCTCAWHTLLLYPLHTSTYIHTYRHIVRCMTLGAALRVRITCSACVNLLTTFHIIFCFTAASAKGIWSSRHTQLVFLQLAYIVRHIYRNHPHLSTLHKTTFLCFYE